MLHKAKLTESERMIIFGTLLGGSLIGLVASAVLSYEAIVLARESTAVLSCDLNAIVSCGTVGRHASSYIFGFPNSFIGMVAMPVFITIAVAGLARTQFPRWFMKAAEGGAVVSLLFAAWMLYMSLSVIGALCPWCLTTDLGVLLIVFALIRYNASTDNLCIKGSAATRLKAVVRKNYDVVVLISVIVLVVATILAKYGSQLF